MSQIHQEVRFAAAPSDVYRALCDEKTFSAWSGEPATISGKEGGAYSCFGPFIVGRQIELRVDLRIVQAWRVFNWPEGVYSLVRFELRPDGDGTRLVRFVDVTAEGGLGQERGQ